MQAPGDQVPAAADVPLDATAAGANGGPPPPVIVSTAPGIVLTPLGKFWHKACLAKMVVLCVCFGVLAILGQLLDGIGQGLLAQLVLSVGPAIMILGFFHQRYALSATSQQTAYTFMEAILWMIPLFMILRVVDPIIQTRRLEASCTYDAAFGRHFLSIVGTIAQCAPHTGARPWKCSDVSRGIAEAMGDDGSFPSRIFEGLNKGRCKRPARGEGLDALAGKADRVAIRAVRQGDSGFPVDHKLDLYAFAAEHSSEGGLLDDQGEVTIEFESRDVTWFFVFTHTHFREAFLEESLKYVAVRRIVFKDHVADCGALVVYALAAAVGFATAEHIMNSVLFRIRVGSAELLMAVLLHCVTGLIIGIHMGYRKFLGRNVRFLHALGVPVLVHGTYALVLRSHGMYAFLVLALGTAYCRWAWLQVDNVCVVDVHGLQTRGELSEPVCCCCAGDCFSALRQAQDPALRQAPELAARVETVARRSVDNIFPQVPSCQTMEISCRVCQRRIRCSTRYPSFCPACGASATMP